MEIINQPVNGLLHPDLLMLSPEIVAEFKAHYLKSWPRTTLHSLCDPLSEVPQMVEEVRMAVALS